MPHWRGEDLDALYGAWERDLFIDLDLNINRDAMRDVQRCLDKARNCGFGSGLFSSRFVLELGTLYPESASVVRTCSSSARTAGFLEDAIDLLTGPGQVTMCGFLGEYPGAGSIERPLACSLTPLVRIRLMLRVQRFWGPRGNEWVDVLSRYSLAELARMVDRRIIFPPDPRVIFRSLLPSERSRSPFWQAFRQRRMIPQWETRLDELALERRDLLEERGRNGWGQLALHEPQGLETRPTRPRVVWGSDASACGFGSF